MTQYIDKSALVAEIEKRRDIYKRHRLFSRKDECDEILSFLDTLEVEDVDLEKEATEFVQTKEFVESKESPVLLIAKHFFKLGLNSQTKDMIEALRTEYEKGRADVIEDTLSWLENCWPRYCSNHTIIEGFKEAIKRE